MKRLYSIILLFFVMLPSAFARIVEGRVHYGGRMLSGVIVSDGRSFAKTSADGTFRIDIKADSEYIFIVTPSGFVSSYADGLPSFWQKTEGRKWFDFEVLPSSPSEDYTILAFDALQIFGSDNSDALETELVPDMVSQAVTARIKGLTSGLLLWPMPRNVGGQALKRVREQLIKLKIPLYLFPGEGPDCQAFFIGGDLVIGTRQSCGDASDFITNLLAVAPRANALVAWPGAEEDLSLPSGREITLLRQKDNAPIGFEVYSKRGGALSWHYHSTRHGDSYQAEIIPPGRNPAHSNELLVNIWDYDNLWKVSWTGDGEAAEGKAPMKQVGRGLLSAIGLPRYASKATVLIESRFGQKWELEADLFHTDIQHSCVFRDMTEGAFLKMALPCLGDNSIEMGLQLTTDGKVVVLRDPYPKYTSEKSIEVGQLIDEIESRMGMESPVNNTPINYTFALNSGSGPGEGRVWPEYRDFADRCLAVLLEKNLGDRLLIESFDDRILNYIHREYPQVELCYLVDTQCGSFNDYMSLLDFTPRWIGFQYEMFDSSLMNQARECGMRVAVWDVSDTQFIMQLLKMGVDSIITDNVDSVLEVSDN